MVYRLINLAGCWKNSRRICKPRAAREGFTNSSSVLPGNIQVVYQPINHKKLVVYCFYIIIQKTREISTSFPAPPIFKGKALGTRLEKFP